MSQTIKVLVADDEAELRKYIRHVLESEIEQTIQFTEAENGAEVLEKLEEEIFDLILLDVKMPVMDGLQALANIKNLEINSFIVMITAHGNVRDAVKAIKDGAYDYLEKPLDKEKIIEIFKKALEAKQL